MKKLISATFLAGIGGGFAAIPAMAQRDINLSPQSGTQFFPTITTLRVPTLISSLITLALVVAAIVFFFMLLVGGVRWIMSGGDKASVEAARNQITHALIGLVIVFAAWAIAALINTFFAINIFQLTIPTFFGAGGPLGP